MAVFISTAIGYALGMSNPPKTNKPNPVLLLSDLPAWGRVALALAIPILERKKIQTCSLPTALLSTHGGYADAVINPQTDYLKKAIAHLQTLELSFSAVYTGFIADPEQFGVIAPLVDHHAEQGAFILIDPILGDNGKLYGLFKVEMIALMRDLTSHADMITPNITEAALLLGKDPASRPASRQELRLWMRQLSAIGPRFIVLTSAPCFERDDRTGVAFYDSESQRFDEIHHALDHPGYPGTGDYLAATLLSELIPASLAPGRDPQGRLKGIDYQKFKRSVKRATSAVKNVLKNSRRTGGDPRRGILQL